MQVGKGPTKMKAPTDAQCLDDGHIAVLKPERLGESLEVQSESRATNVEGLDWGAVEMKPEEVNFISKGYIQDILGKNGDSAQ